MKKLRILFLFGILLALGSFTNFSEESMSSGLTNVTEAYSPAIISDSSGNMISAWVGTSASTGNHVIQVSTLVNGGSWSTAVIITSETDENVFCVPRLAIDSSGDVVLAYCAYDFIAGIGMLKTISIQGVLLGSWGTWGSIVPVSEVTENLVNDFRLIENGLGEFTLLWSSTTGSDPSSIRVSSAATYNGVWSAPVTLSN